MPLGDEVRRLRQEAGLSQEVLADRVGITQSFLSRLEAGKKDGVSNDVMFKLCGALGVSCEHFRLVSLGLEPVRPHAPAGLSAPVRGTVAAGKPLPPADRSGQRLDFSKYAAPGVFALKVRGNSMIEDLVTDGDYLIVRGQPMAEVGEPIVATLNGEVTFKRFHRGPDGLPVLMPRNRDHKPIWVTDRDDFSIVGVVIGMHRTM